MTQSELEAAVERAARALCDHEDRRSGTGSWEYWSYQPFVLESYRDLARAGLRAAGLPTLLDEVARLRAEREALFSKKALTAGLEVWLDHRGGAFDPDDYADMRAALQAALDATRNE